MQRIAVLLLSLSQLDELCVHKRSTESQLVTHRCSQRSTCMYTVNNLRSSWPCKRHRSSSHAQCTKSKTNCVVAVICVAQLFHHSPRRLALLFRTSSISQTDLFFSNRPVVHSPLSICHHHRPSTSTSPLQFSRPQAEIGFCAKKARTKRSASWSVAARRSHGFMSTISIALPDGDGR